MIENDPAMQPSKTPDQDGWHAICSGCEEVLSDLYVANVAVGMRQHWIDNDCCPLSLEEDGSERFMTIAPGLEPVGVVRYYGVGSNCGFTTDYLTDGRELLEQWEEHLKSEPRCAGTTLKVHKQVFITTSEWVRPSE